MLLIFQTEARKMYSLSTRSVLLLLIVIIAVMPSCTPKQAATENSYRFVRGFPADAETITRAQDATDLRRAIEAYKFFFPTVSTEAVMQQFEPNGAVANEVGIIMPQDPEQQFSLANQDTPYFLITLDLRVAGPVVIDLPEGPYIGLINDHNMDWAADLGTIGPGQGKGEKDVIVPPGFKGVVPDEYNVFEVATNKVVLGVRVMSSTGSYEESVAIAKKIKLYPLDKADNPPTFEVIDVKGQAAPLPLLKWEKSMEYWRQLHAVLDSEVIVDKQRIMLGMLVPLGIEPGRPFAPNARQENILRKAASIAFAEMNVAFYANPRPEKIVWDGLQWEWLPVSGPVDPDTKEFGTKDYRDLLASDHIFFAAWGMSAAIGRREVGPGSIYFTALKDSSGSYLDGGANYTLSIPAPVPASLFWSVTVYDAETRTIIDTEQGRGAIRTMFENPQVNSNNKFDLYFGPDAPEGKENHWVRTDAGKGWFALVRMYGPQAAVFDGSYRLPDIEKVE